MRSEFEKKNLWAPWRMEYIQGLSGSSEGCFLCGYANEPENDAKNFVLFRTEHSMAVFNKFPYNNGHIMICPLRHTGDIADLGDNEMLDLFKGVKKTQALLRKEISPDGFNVGINIGRCAGAGLPGHVHIHIVPRWDGDTNFMAVCGQTDVVSQGLRDLYDKLIKHC
ncbi:HIT family protein [Sedimentisphaera salicampi]|uniref:AP-4-A phosphorylase n=1 Tax=Sedimentisphaera salicampi TaxID=1941349 RepID=A0A1W6LKR6_9BACT|nr:HIT domain-containing protein [Sedimentisphaera salicampi]ARN56367.1 AP-4-A phosphorylase [Sedimentisphaera salicampi]OXU15253.1 AP-4-A phosphorylase [Sedimentisphaera salicampi]